MSSINFANISVLNTQTYLISELLLFELVHQSFCSILHLTEFNDSSRKLSAGSCVFKLHYFSTSVIHHELSEIYFIILWITKALIGIYKHPLSCFLLDKQESFVYNCCEQQCCVVCVAKSCTHNWYFIACEKQRFHINNLLQFILFEIVLPATEKDLTKDW